MSTLQQKRNGIEFVYPRDSALSGEALPFAFGKSARNHIDEQSAGSHDCNKQREVRTIDQVIEEIIGHRKTTSKDTPDFSNRGDVILCSGKLSGISVDDAVKDKTGCRPRANSTDGELNLPRRGLCDEGMVLKSHKWSDWRQRTPKGFVNLGNTCFLNATLQCLAYIPPFCQCLVSLEAPSGKLSPGQRITDHLRRLFRQVHDLDPADRHCTNSEAIAPRQLVKAVPLLGSVGSRNGYKFRPGRQEDAHEFLVYLLDAMQDGELRAAGINQHARGWRDRLPIPRLDETTFIHRVFGGYLRSQVRCTKCGYQSNTYDPFLDLALEISKKSSNSIATAFCEFSRKETLDKNNRWRCSGCRHDVCATKQLTVFRPPLSLCIQLKRFTFPNGHGFGSFSGYPSGMRFMGTGGGSKINKAMEFPAQFNLPLSDGRKCEYALTGIIAHLGTSATSGHYTAFVRKPGSESPLTWFHMDDSFVEPVTEKTVLRQKDAYVLFYCRTEVKLELPSPPLRASMTADEARRLNVLRSKSRGPLHKHVEKSLPRGCKDFFDVDISGSMSIVNPEECSPRVGVIDRKFDNGIEILRRKEGGDKNVNGDSPDKLLQKFVIPEESLLKNDGLGENANGDSSDKALPGGDIPDHDSLQVFEAALPTTTANTQSISPCGTRKTRVVRNRCSSQGQLEIMIGPRYKVKRVWKPQLASTLMVDDQHGLLGCRPINKWQDEDPVTNGRSNALKEMNHEDTDRKKLLQVGRWDSILDQGRTKRVKIEQVAAFVPSCDTKSNAFQRIQDGIQSINRQRFNRKGGVLSGENGLTKGSSKGQRKA